MKQGRYHTLAVEDGIATVTIERQDRMNALHPAAHHELSDAFDRLPSMADVRVVIVTGAGDRAFCAGYDLKDNLETGVMEIAPTGFAGFNARIDYPLPVIAAVNGMALGGGFELALACDFRVATTRARMGCVETRVGMVITGGTSVLLPHLVGQGLARQIVLCAEVFDAAAAHHMGLLHRLVDPASLEAEVQALAGTLLSRAPLAVRESKRLLNRPLESELERAFQNELEAIMRCFRSADAHEASVAFREKRPPVFRGE